MKWLEENGRKPRPDDVKYIMSHSLNFTELITLLGANIPDQFIQELERDLDEELRSIILYENTLSTLEELKN
jgi:rubrerythrin